MPATRAPDPLETSGPVAIPGPGRDRAKLVVVRHGETEWSRTHRHTGRTNLPLDPAGVDQAAGLRSRLAGHHFALVLVSPLLRAQQTCEEAGFGAVAETFDDLREWDYGAYEGLTTEEIRAQQPTWSLWRDGAPDGETPTQVGARADAVVARARAQGGDVLAFAHGHILRVVAARWLGLAPREGSCFALDPATVSVLGWERDAPVASRWNDDGGDPFA